MFDFLHSPEKKLRKSATQWLEVADRVDKFRRDQLTEAQNLQLRAATDSVKARLKGKAEPSQLKLAIDSLEGVLRQTGGRIYPASSMVENVEFFLVAAIVILGLRAYFIQPFKIPTNSMWPSYYGMTAQVFKPGEEPGVIRKALRLVALGAINHTLLSPADGEVMIPVFNNLQVAYTDKPGRSLGIFPTTLREYSFRVGGQTATLTVPADFQGDFAQVLDDAFRGSEPDLLSVLRKAATRTPAPEHSTLMVRSGAQTVAREVYWLPIGRKAHQGDKLLSFDLLTGDMLLVDRLSYNFFAPKVGSGFVFRTSNIEDYKAKKSDIYLVKRLVGIPGDVLEIKAPVLFRNGSPIDGSPAFALNARREDNYPGYTNTTDGLLPRGISLTVPAHAFFALGDNSPRSYDSRYWGFVPEKDVVGHPLFIYYPLSSRWGNLLSR